MEILSEITGLSVGMSQGTKCFFFFRQAERPLPQIDADAIRDTHNAHERGVNMLVT